MVGWIKMPLGKEADLGPGHIVLDGDPVGTQWPLNQPLPTFWPMSIVAKRSPISATAEFLFCHYMDGHTQKHTHTVIHTQYLPCFQQTCSCRIIML